MEINSAYAIINNITTIQFIALGCLSTSKAYYSGIPSNYHINWLFLVIEF